MKKEIERKFLVYTDRLPKLVRGKKIFQGYFAEEPVVRIRLKENRAYLTIKSRQNAINWEYEYKLPLRDGRSLISQCKTTIEKTRYNFKLNSDIWEIDIFSGANKGLIIAEIELASLHSRFQKPLWIAKEVTNDIQYSNVNLAKKPYNSW